MSALTEETLSVSGALLSKLFSGQQRSAATYVEENERLAALSIRQQLVSRAFFAVVSTFFSITPVLVYLVAGLELSHGNHSLTAGTIIAVTTLQARPEECGAGAMTRQVPACRKPLSGAVESIGRPR